MFARRFIRGHNYEFHKVCEMVEKFLDWRDENKVDDIRRDIIENNLDHWLKFPSGQVIAELMASVVISPYAVDKSGCPICVDQYNFSPSYVLDKISLEDYVKYTIYTLEFRSMVLEQLSEEREQQLKEQDESQEISGIIVQTCVVRDLSGLGFEHISKQGQVLVEASFYVVLTILWFISTMNFKVVHLKHFIPSNDYISFRCDWTGHNESSGFDCF